MRRIRNERSVSILQCNYDVCIYIYVHMCIQNCMSPTFLHIVCYSNYCSSPYLLLNPVNFQIYTERIPVRANRYWKKSGKPENTRKIWKNWTQNSLKNTEKLKFEPEKIRKTGKNRKTRTEKIRTGY